MQNNATKPLTFVDVIRMFKTKTVIVIVCISLVAALLGGLASFLYLNRTPYYGSEITFYLTSKDGTHALLPLLNSDSFAEKLLLDENGLPPKAECDENDYNTALEAVKAYNDALNIKRDSAKKAESLIAKVSEKKAIYDSRLAEYTRIYDLLSAYLNAYNSAAADGAEADASNLISIINDYQKKLDDFKKDYLDPAKNDYNDVLNTKNANDVTLANAKKDVESTRSEMEKALEDVLAPWREGEDVRQKVSVIRESVSFEYAKLNDSASSTATDNENAAFLVITVSVANDEETAEFITEQIISIAPDYVEKNIERITDVSDPHCTLISTFANTQKDIDNEMWINVLLVGAGLGIGTMVASCFIVVIYNLLPDDMKKKKKA